MRAIIFAVLSIGTVSPVSAGCSLLAIGVKASGQASGAEPFTCFNLSTPVGKKVTLIVRSPAKDMAFNIFGVVDNQERHSFTATKPSYKVDVYRTFTGGPARFELLSSAR